MPTDIPLKARFANRGTYDDVLIARGIIIYVDELSMWFDHATRFAGRVLFGPR